LLGEDPNDKSAGWSKVSTSNDKKLGFEATIHSKAIPNTKVKMTRSDILYKNMTQDKFMQFV